MMRNGKLLVVSVLTVMVMAFAGCTSVLPSAVSSVQSLAGDVASLLPNVGLGRSSAVTEVSVETSRPASAQAQTVAPAVTVNDLQTALMQIYDEVNPSVVNIRVSKQLTAMNLPAIPGLPEGQWPFGQLPEGQGLPETTGEGSGFVWDAEGHIVTNNHVVDGATNVVVTFSDGTSVDAGVIGTDADSDLAVIAVDPSKVDLKPVTVADSTLVRPGQLVVAIGNPFGLEGSMTFGIVSALGRTLDTSSSMTGLTGSYSIPDIIQTDAPVNPGNSGGVLLDLAGHLIGVPTAIESAVSSSAGVGFAVPSVIVQKVVPVLIEKGEFQHPYIGISGNTLSSPLAAAMGLPTTQRGALVYSVSEGGPAEKAGLRGSTKEVEIDGEQITVGGDVIVAIGGQRVDDFEDLTAYLARFGVVGQRVEIEVLRDGKTVSLNLTLGARPRTTEVATAEPEPQTRAANAWLGVSGTDLNAELAEAMDLGQDQTGVLIQTVTRGSPAEEAGLQGGDRTYRTADGQLIRVGGDVITAIDGDAVATSADLSAAIAAHGPGDEVTLTVLRGGDEVEVPVTLQARTRN